MGERERTMWQSEAMWFGGMGVGLMIGAGIDSPMIAVLGAVQAVYCAWLVHRKPRIIYANTGEGDGR